MGILIHGWNIHKTWIPVLRVHRFHRESFLVASFFSFRVRIVGQIEMAVSDEVRDNQL